MCWLVLLSLFTWQWISLCHWSQQSVIVRKAVSYTSAVPVSLLHLPNSLQLPPSLRLSGSLLMSLFSVSLDAESHGRYFSCHPRTPEAICQFQLASRVHRTLVTRSNLLVVVRRVRGLVRGHACVLSMNEWLTHPSGTDKSFTSISSRTESLQTLQHSWAHPVKCFYHRRKNSY